MTEFHIPKNSGRIIVASDSHLGYFDSVAGYTSRERNRHMAASLIAEKPDAVIFAGDMTFRNVIPDLPLDQILEWRSLVIDPLKNAKIPAFAINASHDSLTADEFRAVFGYSNNYAVISGGIAFICLDTYQGARDKSMQTSESDISREVLSDALGIISRSDVEAAFVVCHFPNSGENLVRLMSDTRVAAVVAGHTHDNFVTTVDAAAKAANSAPIPCAKPLLQTGHYSRASAKLIRHGCGFKPFVPMLHGDGMTVSELDGVTPIEDFSRTGSPWQYRAFERVADAIESYMIFAEADYAEFTGEGNVFPAFHQPHTVGHGDRACWVRRIGRALS